MGHLPVSWRTEWPPTVSLMESTEQLVDTLGERERRRRRRREGVSFHTFEVRNSCRKVEIVLRKRYVVGVWRLISVDGRIKKLYAVEKRQTFLFWLNTHEHTCFSCWYSTGEGFISTRRAGARNNEWGRCFSM